MKISLFCSAFLMVSCVVSSLSAQQTPQQSALQMNNPFLTEWNTPFGTPPFDSITNDHFLPAYEEGIRQQREAIAAIEGVNDPPTFVNTIEALEKSNLLLIKVRNVFEALNDANTSDTLQEIARKTAPMLSKLNDDIALDGKLFARVKTLYEGKEKLNLTAEQQTVLKNYYEFFVRGGANLPEEKKAEFRRINEELSVLSLKFGENLLKETVAIALLVHDKNDLAGLPADAVTAAADLAAAKGQPGKWAFTLQKPSLIPFLQYGENRPLREKLFRAYCNRGNNNNEYDNKKILSRIAALRVKRAQLLGFKTYADYTLKRNMAKSPDKVYSFLNDLWKPAQERAKTEAADMQRMIASEGKDFQLQPWDWWYYAEKVKKEKYALDEEMLRPYFKMENVRQGAFDVASRLYGITFEERKDIPVYQSDVTVFEVKEADGTHIGLFYSDYFPRESKRSGAWSSSFRDESNMDGSHITPLVFNVGNFAKPTAEKPSLMSVDEVKTLFHEFGHALHALFARTTYPNAQNVPQDFVELPSQVMENWALDPQVLKMYAKHYQTGEPMPDDLVNKLERSALFNQGFETVEYLAASFLDMDWHTIADSVEQDVPSFEKASLKKMGIIPQIEPRYMSTNFQHVFAGTSYSAGYYSYIWAAVLDADAFEAFKEKKNIFDQETAMAFRNEILSKGGSEDVMTLYKRFRGREPVAEPLLSRRGLR